MPTDVDVDLEDGTQDTNPLSDAEEQRVLFAAIDSFRYEPVFAPAEDVLNA